MLKRTGYFFILLLLGFLGYFWLRGANYIDPDFGWHIRMGQLILSKGIPATDPFSYTMPSYPFVDHEWLMNVLLFWLLPVVGYAGLAGIFTLIALGAAILQWRAIAKQQRQLVFIPFFLALMVLGIFFGIRPQVISWFFFSLILFIVRDWENFRKWRLWLPVVFFVWANLHGGFPIGIVTLLLSSIYWLFKGRYSISSTSVVFLLCVGATFITPYGWRTWWEVGMQMTDSSLRWAILEWMPVIIISNFSFWIFFVFSTFFVFTYRKKFTFLDMFLYFGLLAAGFSSVRNIPFWVIIAMPLTTQGLFFLHQEAAKIQYGSIRLAKALIGFFVIIFIISMVELLPNALLLLGHNVAYPSMAVNYFRLHLPKGQIFSSYDWGGYLIWKLPEKKVFVDGRMPSWRWEAHIAGESDYAFDEYRKFLNGDLSFRGVTSKYGISTLLIPVERKEDKNMLAKQMDRFDNFVKKGLHIKPEKETGFSKVVTAAKKAGWVVVYKDKDVVVYQDKTREPGR